MYVYICVYMYKYRLIMTCWQNNSIINIDTKNKNYELTSCMVHPPTFVGASLAGLSRLQMLWLIWISCNKKMLSLCLLVLNTQPAGFSREYSIVVRVSPMIDTQIVSSCKDKSWWLLAHCRALSLLPLTHVYLFILVQFLVVLLD